MAELDSKNSPSVMPASSPSSPPPSSSSSRPSHVWTTDSLFEDYLTIRLPFPSLSNLRSLIDELKEEFCPADSTLTIPDLSYFSADRLGVRLDANLRFEDLDKGFKRRAYQICNLKNLCEKANLFDDDAGAKDDLNRIFYVLNESYNKIKGDSLLYHLLDEVRTIVIPSQFQYEHVLNFDAAKLSSFQKLLVFVSRELRTAQFRMINDCLHEQIVMERVVTDEGETAVEYELTHAWKPAETKTLRDFLNAKIQRETNWEMWVHFTNPHDNGDKLISHLTITDQLDCPKLKRNRYLWSWRDGLYNAQYDMFFPFSRRQEWSRLAEEIQTHRLSLGWEGYVCLPPTNLDVAVTFFDRDFGLEISPETETEGGERWYDPSLLEATKFESILTTQKLSPETIDFVYMMLARLFFPVNQLDKWQVVLFIKGVAGSGKSTIAQLVRSLYPKECVTTLSSNMERQFGLSAIYNGLICVCSEVREDFALDQGEFQQIISGEEVQISVKNKTAFSHVWDTPLLLLGNQLFKYSDASGSITRRIAMIEFNEQVKKSQSDPLLMEKLQTELSIVMRKGVWLYHKFVRTHARADFWSFAPPQMREFHNNVRSAVDTLVSFLESKCLTFGNNHDIHFMPLSDFKQMYFSHVIRDGGAKPQWKRDHYQTVFNENNLYIETKRRKRTYQGVDMVCEWVIGCCPLDTGDSANAMMMQGAM